MKERQPHQDQRYIEALLNNDERLIREIYEQHSQAILRYVHQNNGNEEDARDLFQQVLIAVLRRARQGDFTLTCPFGGYLFIVCKSLWINELEKRKRHRVTSLDDDGYNKEAGEDTFAQAEETLSENQKFERYQQALDSLGEDCRQLIKLPLKGHSLSEVAELMGITYGYARKRRCQCMDKLVTAVQTGAKKESI